MIQLIVGAEPHVGHIGWGSTDNSAHSYMSDLLPPVGQGRIIRRSKNKLNQPFRKRDAGQKSLLPRDKIWNLYFDLKIFYKCLQLQI